MLFVNYPLNCSLHVTPLRAFTASSTSIPESLAPPPKLLKNPNATSVVTPTTGQDKGHGDEGWCKRPKVAIGIEVFMDVPWHIFFRAMDVETRLSSFM